MLAVVTCKGLLGDFAAQLARLVVKQGSSSRAGGRLQVYHPVSNNKTGLSASALSLRAEVTSIFTLLVAARFTASSKRSGLSASALLSQVEGYQSCHKSGLSASALSQIRVISISLVTSRPDKSGLSASALSRQDFSKRPNMDHVLITPLLSLNVTSAATSIRTMSSASLVAYKHLGSQLRSLTYTGPAAAVVQESSCHAILGGGFSSSSISKLQQQQQASIGISRIRCSSASWPYNSAAMQSNAARSIEAAVLAPPPVPNSQDVNNLPGPNIAPRWRELHGSNDWKGLLEPHLDADLRSEIVRYGEFVQVTYDSFDHDKHSIFLGSNRYRKEKLFEKVNHLYSGYEVTQYIYATADLKLPKLLHLCTALDAWSKNSNWMGYVAVCTDVEKIKRLGRRDILIAWRGTIMNTEWAANVQFKLVPAGFDPRPSYNLTTAALRVEMGFLNLYTSKNPETRYNKTSARQQVLTELKRLLQLYKGEELSITVTGHSLGSALATLNAYDIAQSGLNRIITGKNNNYGDNNGEKNNSPSDEEDDYCPIPENWGDKTASPVEPGKEPTVPIAVFSYAGPRVGNNAFCNQLKALGVNVLRVVNVNDIVPRVPGSLLPPTYAQPSLLQKFIDWLPFTYLHPGVQLLVNNFDSPFLEAMRATPPNCHNLEGYLHVVAGHRPSVAEKFAAALSRDIALVNKSSDFLKDVLYVPDSWWQVANKGLVYQDSDGKWIQELRDDEDVPVPPPDNHVSQST